MICFYEVQGIVILLLAVGFLWFLTLKMFEFKKIVEFLPFVFCVLFFLLFGIFIFLKIEFSFLWIGLFWISTLNVFWLVFNIYKEVFK